MQCLQAAVRRAGGCRLVARPDRHHERGRNLGRHRPRNPGHPEERQQRESAEGEAQTRGLIKQRVDEKPQACSRFSNR